MPWTIGCAPKIWSWGQTWSCDQVWRVPSKPLLYEGDLTVHCTWVDQMWTHLSKLPEARNFPSGEKATEYTGSECLVRVWMQAPLSTSHSLTVESNEALENWKSCIFIFYTHILVCHHLDQNNESNYNEKECLGQFCTMLTRFIVLTCFAANI